MNNVRPLFVLPGGDAAPDPHEQHRAEAVEMLEGIIAAVRAGHIDGVMAVTHHSPTHPTGCGWGVAYTGNLDPVMQLGGLELVKHDIISQMGAGRSDG